MFDPSRVNHFQTVPALPGAQPLTIAGWRQPKNKKGKGRGGKVSGKGKGNGDEKSPQRSKRNRGDDELLQLDLKRKSHLLSQNVAEQALQLKEQVVEQLAVTDGSEELTDHRALVESRLNQVLALASDPDASHLVLSPGCKKAKNDFFSPDDGKLSENIIKTFQKKFKAAVQLVNNASEGLNAIHQELCALEDEEMEEEPAEDGADSIPDYLKHLPVEQHKLLKDIVEIILAKPKIVECGWVQGAAHMGLPHDPSKPTTCCYILQNLDASKIELGGLPRDEI